MQEQITLPEFLNLVKDIERPSEMSDLVAKDYYDDTFKNQHYDENFELSFIWLVHETGGVRGGSCWDSSDPQEYINNEEMPEFVAFDEVLNIVYPDISHLQYNVIWSEFVKEIDYRDCEYYGNYTDYEIKYVSLCDLYTYLIDHDLLK